jgi:hypothetical protein
MNNFETVALVIAMAWLGVLTLVTLLLVRQMGILTVRLSMGGSNFSLAHDGPEVGSKVPAEALAILPRLERGRTVILHVSATCSPCRELVTSLKGRALAPHTIAWVAGRTELADALVSLLPAGMTIVRDPDVTELAKIFHIHLIYQVT